MSTNLFVYGTLMFPQLVYALTKKKFKTQELNLKGYSMHKIIENEIEKAYPGAKRNKDEILTGKILFDIDNESLNIIDFFEYGYKKEKVVLNHTGEIIEFYIYLWDENNLDMLKGKWSKENFEEKHLKKYLTQIIPKDLEEYNALKIKN